MLKKVLVANRGEVAIRIIRSLKDLGIATVSVYSLADKDQLHVTMADESVCIGGNRAQDSYLNMDSIISAAQLKNCDSIHPGYGFLAENPVFAKRVEDAGIKFIGPSAQVISLMGDKSKARELMASHGIPTVPGSDGPVREAIQGKEIAKEIGLPVLIKASAGGGGKGMRMVRKIEDFDTAFQQASAEALAAFGNGEVYIEKLIERPKHIEIQILADNYGNIIHLGERDCSIQRRNQKLIEEAPSKSINPKLREEMGFVATKAARACNYTNAGTVEFVLDQNGNYYFIEMNTRLQVEHPVTEMITGIDIVRQQIRIASGLRLKYRQEDIKFSGHAIELRINAENVCSNFMPSTGQIDFFYPPGGFNTRFDSFIYTGCKISPYYDSMIGKIIVHGKTRLNAVRRLRRAIEETFITGVYTNMGLHYAILHDFEFLRGNYTTSYMNDNLDQLLEQIEVIEDGII